MSKEQYQGLGLSDEELAALEGYDDQETPEDNLLDDDDDDSGDDDTSGLEDETIGDNPDDDDKPTEPNPAEEVDEKQPPEFSPKVEPVQDYDKVIADLTSKEDALSQQFDDGEITAREYRSQLREIEGQRRTIEDQQKDFERSQELARQKWHWEVETFKDSIKESTGIDYRTNKILNAALDTAVKELAADEANDDKTGTWFLKEAHKRVAELLGKPVATTTDNPIKNALKSRQPDLAKVPQTLADAPKAQVESDGDEFSKLDKLSGMELERALAALTPAQAQAYLER